MLLVLVPLTTMFNPAVCYIVMSLERIAELSRVPSCINRHLGLPLAIKIERKGFNAAPGTVAV